MALQTCSQRHDALSIHKQSHAWPKTPDWSWATHLHLLSLLAHCAHREQTNNPSRHFPIA